MNLYHFTCLDGAEGIRRDGVVKPCTMLIPGRLTSGLPPWSSLVWFTDLEIPMRLALGLTSHSLSCDRTSYRFTATTDAPLIAWVRVRRKFSWADALESEPGSMPVHWWVSWLPTPVEIEVA